MPCGTKARTSSRVIFTDARSPRHWHALDTELIVQPSPHDPVIVPPCTVAVWVLVWPEIKSNTKSVSVVPTSWPVITNPGSLATFFDTPAPDAAPLAAITRFHTPTSPPGGLAGGPA